jgi:hypothetical protein
VDWILELAISVFECLFLTGREREWSFLKTSITIAVVLLLIVLAAYIFLRGVMSP